eukprot:406215_1
MLSTDWSPKFKVGDTIDIYSPGRVNVSSPFDKNTATSFLNEFKELDADGMKDQGLFSYSFNLCNNISSYAESLKVNGSVGANFGVVGADAEVNFCKSQTMSNNDIRLLIQSNHSGHCIVNGKYFKMRLQDSVSNDIQRLSFDEFRQTYGTHLIAGISYGGKSIHMMTYKCKQQSKYELFALKVYVTLKVFGFTVGKIKVADIHNEKLKEKVEVDYDYKHEYFPQGISGTDEKLIRSINDDILTLKNVNDNNSD